MWVPKRDVFIYLTGSSVVTRRKGGQTRTRTPLRQKRNVTSVNKFEGTVIDISAMGYVWCFLDFQHRSGKYGQVSYAYYMDPDLIRPSSHAWWRV